MATMAFSELFLFLFRKRCRNNPKKRETFPEKKLNLLVLLLGSLNNSEQKNKGNYEYIVKIMSFGYQSSLKF